VIYSHLSQCRPSLFLSSSLSLHPFYISKTRSFNLNFNFSNSTSCKLLPPQYSPLVQPYILIFYIGLFNFITPPPLRILCYYLYTVRSPQTLLLLNTQTPYIKNSKNSGKCASLTLLFFSFDPAFQSYGNLVIIQELLQYLIRYSLSYSICWVVLSIDLSYFR
jgi:hypothetical protein